MIEYVMASPSGSEPVSSTGAAVSSFVVSVPEFATGGWLIAAVRSIGVVMIAIAGGVAYSTQARVRVYRDWVVHTYEVRQQIHNLRSTISDLRSTGY